MHPAPLLFVDARASGRPASALSEQARAAAESAQIEFRRVSVGAADELGQVPGPPPLLIVLAPDVAPLFAVTRRARTLWPDALIVLLAPAIRLLALRNELTIRGLFGDLYRTQDTASTRLCHDFVHHITEAQRRRSLHTTLSAINVQLTRAGPAIANVRGLLQSNQYLASVLLNAHDAIAFLDAQGVISLWNNGAVALLGYDEGAVLGRPLSFLASRDEPADRPDLLTVLSAVMDGRAAVRQDLVLRDAAGRRIAVDVTLAEVFDDKGQRLGFSLFMRDITVRRRYEESLAAERERLLVTLRSIGDGVITTDIEGRITLLNPVAEALCGWPLAEALGEPLEQVFRIVDDKTLEVCEDPVRQVLRTNATVELAHNTALVSRDGTRRVIADSGAPIRDAEGLIVGVVLVFRDVTEKQRVEDALLRARQLEAIGFLAGGIAHDFNNILTALFGNISLMRLHTPPGSATLPLLDQAEQAFFRARDLTQQLLTFAKGGAPVKRVGSLSDLLRETARFLLHGTKVSVEFVFPDGLWTAEFDASQMSQAVSNIILNAVQAMPEGGQIRIGAHNVFLKSREVPPLKEGRYVRFTIQDEGPGIPEADRERVFHPYFTTKDAGTGLGLATTYSVIQRHGGHVGVAESARGALFEVYLPASTTALAADGHGDLRGHRPDQGSGYIVVMDDEEPVRKVCAEILGHLGYRVETVADGEALVTLYAERLTTGSVPDAVIVDLTVPGGMDGREAAGRVLALDPKAKLIVSSGYCMDPVMADYKNYGFVGVIAKPYDVRAMAAQLADVTRAPR